MNEIEKAIQTIERYKQYARDTFTTKNEQNDFNLAIAALREQAARENPQPCEYCLILEKHIEPVQGYLGMYAGEHKEILPIISISLIEVGIKISGLTPKFCPMCGRKLDKESEK